MRYSLSAKLLLLLGSSQLAVASAVDGEQVVIAADTGSDGTAPARVHKADDAVLAALKAHADPVDALIALQPEKADKLAERRLIHVFGEKKAEWMTEGDKLRLRRKGKKFRDITKHQDVYEDSSVGTLSGKASKSSETIRLQLRGTG